MSTWSSVMNVLLLIDTLYRISRLLSAKEITFIKHVFKILINSQFLHEHPDGALENKINSGATGSVRVLTVNSACKGVDLVTIIGRCPVQGQQYLF